MNTNYIRAVTSYIIGHPDLPIPVQPENLEG
jgi:hypothetical protein